jgi:hypothetical protein
MERRWKVMARLSVIQGGQAQVFVPEREKRESEYFKIKRFHLFIFLTAVVLAVLIVSIAFAETKGKMELKVGEEIYACNCGPACQCDTLSTAPGKCTCGKEMVKAKVVKVEEGKVVLMSEGWDKERTFKAAGKYVSNCPTPSGCQGTSISQKAGTCVLGRHALELVPSLPPNPEVPPQSLDDALKQPSISQ